MEETDSLIKTVRKQIEKTMNHYPLTIGVDFGCTHLVISIKPQNESYIKHVELKKNMHISSTDFKLEFDEGKMEIQLNPVLNSNEDNYVSALKSCLQFGIQEQIENFSKGKPFSYERGTENIDFNGNGRVPKPELVLKPFELYSKYIGESFKVYSKEFALGNSKNDKREFLFSYPNQYTNFQRDQFKSEFEHNLKLKKGDERVFMYKEAPCALMKIIFDKSDSIVDHEKISEYKKIGLLDIGDSSINITTCIIKGTEIHIQNSGTCSIGGRSYTDKIFDQFISKNKLKLKLFERQKIYLEIRNQAKEVLCTKSNKVYNLFAGEKKSPIKITSGQVNEWTTCVHEIVDKILKEHLKLFEIKKLDLLVLVGGGTMNEQLIEYLQKETIRGVKTCSEKSSSLVSEGLHFMHALNKIKSPSFTFVEYPVYSLYVFYKDENDGNSSNYVLKLIYPKNKVGNVSVKTLLKGFKSFDGAHVSFNLFQSNSIEDKIIVKETDEVFYLGNLVFKTNNTKKLDFDLSTTFDGKNFIFDGKLGKSKSSLNYDLEVGGKYQNAITLKYFLEQEFKEEIISEQEKESLKRKESPVILFDEPPMKKLNKKEGKLRDDLKESVVGVEKSNYK
jgi:hypothetical protein